jgi:deazaflavin-dependent oxidoreductase (nitroreductase family)
MRSGLYSRPAMNPWSVLYRAIDAHTLAYRATRGLVGHRFPGAPPMLLLDHVGARSGRRRTLPLSYIEDGDDLVIVASKGGNPDHPAWYLNLRANPEVEVQIRGDKFRAHARDATPEERPELWRQMAEIWPDYDTYQGKTDREIPIVRLITEPSE